MSTPDFRKGADAAAEAAKFTSFAKTHFFSLDDNETAIVRFVTDMDEWIVVDQHGNVPTRPKPADLGADGKWPSSMGAVCRKDTAFGGMFADCYICEFVKKPNGKANRPSARSWGIGVLREVVKGDDGKPAGYRDMKRTVAKKGDDGKETGETHEEKAFVVFNMGFKNFLTALRGYANVYGTIVDRDYMIQRSGTELDTQYTIIPLDPIEGHDLRDPDVAAKYVAEIDLAAEVTQRASDDFYARFFDVRVAQPSNKTNEAATGGAPQAEQNQAPQADLDAAELAALAARVKGHTAAESAPAEQPAPAAEQPAAEKVPEPAAAAAGGGMKNFDG